MINEPNAAAIAYGHRRNRPDKKENVVVFDMGGGILDVSFLTIEDELFDVRATAGDPYLGGEDFVFAMVDECVSDFQSKNPEQSFDDRKRR